jgi:hypothetical protein
MFVRVITVIVILAGVGWGAAAIWFDGPSSRPLAGLLGATFVLAAIGALLFVRPFGRAELLSAVLVGFVLTWWLSIPPSNDRDWQPDVARPAFVERHGNRVTIHNVRNFDYRSETDFAEHWETRTFDLDRLSGVDLFLSFWGPTLIAHTIMSWQFDDGSHLAVSIETRKEKGESYSAVRGFFRQYELYYVVADERDVIRLRTTYRGEQVFLYRLNASNERARAVLLDYLEEIDRLARQAKWYNALTHNCTTAIRYHVQRVAPTNRWSWKILANGYLDELLYERRGIDTSIPFSELRARSDITGKAKAAGRSAAFSARIREGLLLPKP